MKVASALPWTAPIWQRLTEQNTQNRLGHAILLLGQEGLGKRVLLRELAQYLLCTSIEVRPCGECASCRLFNAANHPDLLMVEPEEKGKQIKIEQIRKVTEFVNTTAQKSHHKVIVLGPAEAMNINASNALLKSLEEPSSQVTLLLYTHQPSRLLATIKSRCQQYAMTSPSFDDALQWLNQNSEEMGLESLLRLAKGAPLKALSMVEQNAHVQYMQFCQDMTDLAQQGVNWSVLVGKWKAWNQEWLLQWFYELLLDVQKQTAGLPTDQLAIAELANQSAALAKPENYARVQQFIDKLIGFKQAQSSQNNPNAQLIIETLLIDWLSLMGQSRA